MVTKTEYAIKYLESPDKSDHDKKLYKSLILPNGLRVLLVSDPTPVPHTGLTSSEESSAGSSSTATGPESTSSESPGEESSESTTSGPSEVSSSDSETGDEKLAAVALMVDVGSFSEPKIYQGLAHFLEHMIFMGSEKYPAENAFDAHIKKCGGSNNAQTDAEETIFYFEVPEEHLDSSIDYFSALLKTPLMLKEAMTRERDSVDSEFQQVQNDDEARRDQLLASMGAQNYPHNNFSWGNLVSLRKSELENADDHLHAAVHEFCKRHYSAHRMYVCMQARLPLPEMEDLAVKHFSDVPCNGMDGMDISGLNFRQAFIADFHEKVFFMKPVQNVCKIEFTWVLPPTMKSYRCKPAILLSQILGYEGEGSLCAYLRRKLWGLVVIAGVNESGFDDNNIYSLFNLCIHLTDDGYRHLDDVLKATFAYIKLLIQPGAAVAIRRFYDEEQQIAAMNFRYTPERPAYDNVQRFVVYSKIYPPKDILTGSICYFEYDESQIQEIIDLLNEFKFNIMIIAQQPYEGITNYDKREEWFGTEYTTRPMPEQWIRMWEKSEPVEGLYLPLPNEFITNDFRILHETCKPELILYPVKLLKNDVCELWFRPDEKFHLPEAYMHFYFISPLLKQSPKNDVMCTLFAHLVKHHVAEKLYPATVAGLQYHFYGSDKGLVLKLNGYNEKLYRLVELITQTIVNMKDLMTSEELDVYKTQHGKILFNGLIKPRTLNKDIRLNIVQHTHWSLMARYEFLDTVTIDEMLEFVKKFPKELYIQSLMQGNLLETEAIRIMESTLNVIKCDPIKDLTYIQNRAVQLPQGSHYIRCHGLNEKDVNTIITNFYQIGPVSVELESKLNLLIMFVEEPLFDTLRTKEQLGYHVNGTVRVNFGIIGYTIMVNSQENRHSAQYVDERIEAFRNKMLTIMEEMDEAEFDQVRNSLIKLNQVVDMALAEEMGRNWQEIVTEDYLFDRRRREIEVLRRLTKQDIIDFCLSNERSNFRKLSVQVIGNTAHLKKSEVRDDEMDVFMDTREDGDEDDDVTKPNAEADDAEKEKDMDDLYKSLGKSLKLRFIPREGDATTITDINEFKEPLHVYPVTRIKYTERETCGEYSEVSPMVETTTTSASDKTT